MAPRAATEAIPRPLPSRQWLLYYTPFLNPFQYYASTANPDHARPASVHTIGQGTDGSSHQYDIDDFFDAAKAGNFPAVSYLKSAAYRDGHAGYWYPRPADQAFLVHVINTIEQTPQWSSTVIIITGP